MKYWIILIALTALPWGLAAQNPPPEPLPSAPSATKFPARQTGSPASATSQTSVPPATATPSADPPQPSTTTSPAPQTNAQTAAPVEPPKSNALPDSSGTPPVGANPGEEITTIRKRVNEVNVVFTVTDKRGHFVKDLTRTIFACSTTANQPRVASLPPGDQSALARRPAH